MTALPLSSSERSAKREADGLDNSCNPSSTMAKMPVSDVEPKRFLMDRNIRN